MNNLSAINDVSAASQPLASEGFAELISIIARLRAPGGCPWDAEQTHTSIAHNMIEEAYEAVDAIEHSDYQALCEELGDVLLQVVFQAQIAADSGEFTLAEVIEGINNKLIRRHPHVFGENEALAAADRSLPGGYNELSSQVAAATNSEAVLELWDQIKLREKQEKARRRTAQSLPPAGLLNGVPTALPALMQAQDISRKAVASGFEWQNIQAIWEQVNSEIAEFNAEQPGSQAAEEEFGDVLFSLVNVARVSGIDAESALRAACRKFRQRWAIMEQAAKEEERNLESYSTVELDAFWRKAKDVLRNATSSEESVSRSD